MDRINKQATASQPTFSNFLPLSQLARSHFLFFLFLNRHRMAKQTILGDRFISNSNYQIRRSAVSSFSNSFSKWTRSPVTHSLGALELPWSRERTCVLIRASIDIASALLLVQSCAATFGLKNEKQQITQKMCGKHAGGRRRNGWQITTWVSNKVSRRRSGPYLVLRS